ncbi:MAG: hypothetical protein JXR37_19395 [Kiritimatiellae bacterium]|nr:hypothetical protein [Kiritimatiellia bacterium]
MRTTVDIPDLLLRRAKAAAALAGKKLKTFVTEALEHELEREPKNLSARRRVSLPLVRSKKPGSLRITGDTVSSALASGDADALARH